MNLLNRYLEEVKKHLPKNERKEIILELKSSILDEFDSTDQSEQELERIILSMGSPSEIGSRYQTRPILSKQIEPLYFLLLKIVSGAITLGLSVAKITELAFSNEEFSAITVIRELALMLPDLLMAIITAVGMITIIMFIVDRKFDFKEDEFKLSDLPQVPKPVYWVSRGGAIASIIFTTIFLVVINVVDFDISYNNVKLFADLTNIIMITNIFLIIEIIASIFIAINGSMSGGNILFYKVRQVLGAGFMWYISISHIFNPEQDIIPSFVPYIFRLLFFVLAIFTILNLRKIRKEAN